MAVVRIPSAFAVRMTRLAISPRLAMRTDWSTLAPPAVTGSLSQGARSANAAKRPARMLVRQYGILENSLLRAMLDEPLGATHAGLERIRRSRRRRPRRTRAQT